MDWSGLYHIFFLYTNRLGRFVSPFIPVPSGLERTRD